MKILNNVISVLICFGLISCSHPNDRSSRFVLDKTIGGEDDGGTANHSRHALYTSTDYGLSWNKTDNGLPSGLQVSHLGKMGNDLIMATDNFGVLIKEENKTEWAQIGGKLPGKKVNTLHVSGGNIFTGVYEEGIYVSSDKGASWVSLNRNLTDLRVQAIIHIGNHLYVGTDSGIFRFDEGLKVWDHVFGSYQVNSFSEYHGEIVAGTTQGVLLSKNGGTEWNWIHEKGTAYNTRVLNERIVVMYMSGELFISNEWGSWYELEYLPKEGSYIYDIAAIDNYLIISNNYGIHHSIDGGKTWQHVYKTEKMAFCNILVVGDTIYGGTRRWDENRGKPNF